ncbi:MAG: hypothetical protein HZC36_01245 [Armatimonadetes bacterium]|nr:hypothetical protein [Armatimonadota bacterium]
MLRDAELPLRTPFGVSFGAAIVGALIVMAVRMALNWAGSQLVNWWLFMEYEWGVAACTLVCSLILSAFARPRRPKRFAKLGMALMLGATAAHILLLKLWGHPPSWLTSVVWFFALAGQFMAAASCARWLAVSHVGGEE